ncbi:MAG: hypothetical protein U0234_24635 [Sandaracinus sp.]
MRLLALAFVLVSIASSARAQTAAPAPASPAPLVFVYDGGGAHVSGERVRRALANALHRPVLRLTDDGAGAAVGRFTIAFSPPDRWVIDLTRGEVHTTRTVILRTSTVASLVRVAVTVFADTEPTPIVAAAVTPPPSRRAEWIALIGDEILDPFAGQTFPRHRTLAQVQELVDPFSGSPATRRGYDDVIDPWSR